MTRKPMCELLVATDNEGKLREYRALLVGLPFHLTPPREQGLDLKVDETGSTFAQNALLKAAAYAQASGLLTIADDSGLEVDALGGAPGVHSARYAGPDADDNARVRLLLDNLRDVPWPERAARFRCVIAIVQPGHEPLQADGTCEGYIAFQPAGRGGFGYDPVFYLPDMGRTMAELSPEEKNAISHRALAAAAARPILLRTVNQRPPLGK